MDLNDDGHVDILSGSYSRHTRDMAGLFIVLWGSEDGTFSEAETLTGSDGEPLLIPGSREQNLTDRICTRPTAADINGDGHLDIVSGNFIGTFFVFLGEGNGKFSPECEKLMDGEEALQVQAHSDPFLIDWDKDGDLDIVSGSGAGGVFLSLNAGSKTDYDFKAFSTLIDPIGHENYDANQLGEDHISGPQTATRVWVDDVNKDGKYDLLVGDSLRLMFAAEGVDDETAIKRLTEWNEKQKEVSEWWMEASKDFDMEAVSKLQMRKMELDAAKKAAEEAKESEEGEEGEESEGSAEAANALTEEELATLAAYEEVMKEYSEKMTGFYQSKSEFVRDEMTGSVWVYYQK